LQAIVQANTNPDFSSIAKGITAVVFLGTPHQGAQLANLLDLVLTVSFSSRKFVKQLACNSDTIMEINDSFRHQSKGLKLISFFETQNTRGKKVTAWDLLPNFQAQIAPFW